MKHFAYFIAGILVASLVQSIIPTAAAGWSMSEQKKKDVASYRAYIECRDKHKSKYVVEECLKLYPMYGMQYL